LGKCKVFWSFEQARNIGAGTKMGETSLPQRSLVQPLAANGAMQSAAFSLIANAIAWVAELSGKHYLSKLPKWLNYGIELIL
jgi:hypothetical protein